MTPFFSTSERIAALQAAAVSWSGTPFREGSCAPGARGGVDCVRLVEAVLFASGATGGVRFGFPHVAPTRATTNKPSPFLAWLEGRAADPQSAIVARLFQPLPDAAEVQAGDLLHYAAGPFWHLCLALDARTLLTCVRPVGVQRNRLDDPTYAGRRDGIFRPIENTP